MTIREVYDGYLDSWLLDQLRRKESNMGKCPNTMLVDGEKYIKASTVDSDSTVKIVILQRGWVMVGRLERNGSDCKLHDASVIRKWGTTRGLGEIAEGGPTRETKLDKCNGVVEFDWLTVVASITCEESQWENAL